jgi:hypothetical protein
MTFYRGQKVVCIDDSTRVSFRPRGWRGWFRKFEKVPHNLNKGDTYVITDIYALRCERTGEVFQSFLVDGAWHFGARWMPFPSFQFRPLIERKTDISVFTSMLRPAKRTEKA